MLTCHLQKYKTKTRRVYHCLVFSLITPSLIFVIITILYLLAFVVTCQPIVRHVSANCSSRVSQLFVTCRPIVRHVSANCSSRVSQLFDTCQPIVSRTLNNMAPPISFPHPGEIEITLLNYWCGQGPLEAYLSLLWMGEG